MAQAQAPAAPRLSVEAPVPRAIRLSWPADAADFQLEQSTSLRPGADWRPVLIEPVVEGDLRRVSIEPGVAERFFRLRRLGMPTVLATSPRDGEMGVGVLRETIVEFTGALAPGVSLSTSEFYATGGGRRILSRVELASDRRRASLFYLEPLPGSARIEVTLLGAGLRDSAGRAFDLDRNGVPGGDLRLSFNTLNLAALPGTAVVGTVYASDPIFGTGTTNAIDRPLAGVIITVDGREQELRTTTDVNGRFTLTPVPPGKFFVKIDGRTAVGSRWLQGGAYYPFVGKVWEAEAGRMDNPAGGTAKVYLPLVAADTLVPVNATAPTVVAFPASVVSTNPLFSGVSITVPANALFADDGVRGGRVGLAPVPPDRLPGPLPPGVNPALVITVQTDGPLNFDRPAPVCFPNLPDARTGRLASPGESQVLVSFNHKKGNWEPGGSMTVSADRRFVCSDPGTGVVQPGWHFPAPPPDEPEDPPPPSECPVPGAEPAGEASEAAFHDVGLAETTAERCHRHCNEDLILANAACNAAFAAGAPFCAGAGPAAPECLAAAMAAAAVCHGAAGINWLNCNHRCDEPPCQDASPAAGSDAAVHRALGLHGPPATDAVLAELDALYRQVRELVGPVVLQGNSLSPEMEAQMKALLARADAVAGGDAAEYLREHQAALEDAVRPLVAEFGVDPGNAPGYPVLYHAVLHAPGGVVFHLRGETGPFGDYAIFRAPGTRLAHIAFFDPRTRQYGLVLPRADAASEHRLPRFNLAPIDSSFPDTDGDGLPDAVELVYGSLIHRADTDGDGIGDGRAVDLGRSPLGGTPSRIGVMATAQTLGTAVDVATGNGMALVAQLDRGLAVFDIRQPLEPVLVSQVATPGVARSVAIAASANRALLAADLAGLILLDLTDPAAVRVAQQVSTPEAALAVAAQGTAGFVGTIGGDVIQVELATGRMVERRSLDSAILDLGIAGGHLYALGAATLSRFSLEGSGLEPRGRIALTPQAEDPFSRRKRLFAGSTQVLVSGLSGFDRIDILDPAGLRLAGAAESLGVVSFKQIVGTGSSLGIAAVGTNPRDDGTQDLHVFDLTSPASTTNLVAILPTPGVAFAASVHRGLAFVADGAAGLGVVQFIAPDTRGVAPSVGLRATFPMAPAEVEEGVSAVVTALTTDDVQVREVEFFIDGVRSSVDGTPPFEHDLVVGAFESESSAFRIKARAIDTGGNAADSEEVRVKILRDATAPRVISMTPNPARVLAPGSIRELAVRFSESIVVSTLLSPGRFRLVEAGPDGVHATSDDVPIGGGTVSYQADLHTATLTFASPLPAGRYRGIVEAGVADSRGNVTSSEFGWSFLVFGAAIRPDSSFGGSGVIDTPTARDVYTFEVSPGQRVYFDELTGSNCASPLNWRCVDAEGAVVFDERFGADGPCGPGDAGGITLVRGGTYVLTVYSASRLTGEYGFRVWDVTPQNFEIALDRTVTNGVPAAGAGHLETPGTWDIYTFTATAGQRVYFDELTGSNCTSPLRWSLTGPDGQTLFDHRFGADGPCDAGDAGLMTLTNAGPHTLVVYGVEDGTGEYSFEVWEARPQSFALSLDVAVTNGVPAAGAGHIETPGTWDIYTFTATAGQRVYFDELTGYNCTSPLRWTLTGPDGQTLFDHRFGADGPCDAGDAGLMTLTNAGPHTLVVYGVEDGTGEYSFEVWQAPVQTFGLDLNLVVTNGVPAAGAGHIETPGTWDVYTFTAAAGQRVYFDELTGFNCTSTLRWSLAGPDDRQIFDERFGAEGPCDAGDAGFRTLTDAGTYTLIVYGLEDGAGEYSFELR